MNIRNDFAEVAPHLQRLFLYSQQAEEFNLKDWSHLKTQEDYRRIFQLEISRRLSYEKIYSTGRDLAIWLSIHLASFNDIGSYPTLKAYVDSFADTWVHQVDRLNDIIAQAKQYSENNDTPWAVEQMIHLFEKEIAILQAASVVLNQLRESDIYQTESGQRKPKINQDSPMSHNITFNSPSNVQIGNHNRQEISQVFHQIVQEIESSNATHAQKEEAKSKLKGFLEHPLVCSILGGISGGVFGIK